MPILVTNDDGDSIGLRALLAAAKQLDKTAYAITPHKQRSAVSKALTLHKALRFHPIAEDVYDLNGTPADAVLFALHSTEVPKPTLVLSGINFGDNASTGSLVSSGTLGACWEAALAGVPAIAFSLYKPHGTWKKRSEWDSRQAWGDPKVLEKKAVELVRYLKSYLKNDCFFSVNFPSEPEQAKIVWATKTQRLRFKTVIHKRLDPSGVPYYWIGGEYIPREPGTDLHDVAVNNNIVVTPVTLDLIKHIKRERE